MPLDSNDYARASALITHATLVRSIETSYPTLSMKDQNQILIDILDRIARMRGWGLRREPTGRETEDE
jgi:hypothetical protein